MRGEKTHPANAPSIIVFSTTDKQVSSHNHHRRRVRTLRHHTVDIVPRAVVVVLAEVFLTTAAQAQKSALTHQSALRHVAACLDAASRLPPKWYTCFESLPEPF